MDDQTKKEIREAVQEAFSAGVGDKRFIDVTRIPLICQSIIGIDKKLEELVTKDQFWPVKTLVYGIVGLMLTGIVTGLLMLILK